MATVEDNKMNEILPRMSDYIMGLDPEARQFVAAMEAEISIAIFRQIFNSPMTKSFADLKPLFADVPSLNFIQDASLKIDWAAVRTIVVEPEKDATTTINAVRHIQNGKSDLMKFFQTES